MTCPVCEETLSLFEPYEIVDGERVHYKCFLEK